MYDNASLNLILLTYKGKALLMQRSKGPIDEEKHPWCFIGGLREKGETIKSAMLRRVKKEAGIVVENIEFVSETCFHAQLTDDNVNQIKRDENQLLNFFTIKEIRKLFLSRLTEQFVSKHGDLI
jgi:8-oxo-dGTP pyrophosphatase MutT (NUDIX family)